MDNKTGFARHNVLYVVGVFLLWTVTSFLCHYYGKEFLNLKISRVAESHSGTQHEWQPAMYAALLLTCFQLGLFYLSLEMKSKTAVLPLLTWFTCHGLATGATNISMALMFASSTFAIKLTEPLTTALIHFVVIGAPLSLASTLSLPIIIGGAIVFTGDPFRNPSSSLGLGAALASNIFLSIRNVSFKQIQASEKEGSNILRPRFLGRYQHSLYVCMGLVGVVCFSLLHQDIYPTIVLAYLSGSFHVLYSYTSMGCALQKLPVVTHAVINICKRVFVVLLLYTSGHRQATTSNFLGLAVCTAGLFLYTWDECDPTRGKGKGRIEAKVRVIRNGNGIGKHPYSHSRGSRRVTVVTCMVIAFLLGIAFGNINPFLEQHDGTQKQTQGKTPAASTVGKPQTFNLRALSVSKQSHDVITESGDRFETRTFSHEGLTRPPMEMLMPRIEGLSEAEADEMSEFFNLDLVNHPEMANMLMNQLTSHTDIVREAQRIQFNVFERLLGKYKYAIWIGMAAFENKGDSCISSGEAMLLKRLGIEVLFFCHFQYCTEERLDEARELVRKYSPDEIVILNRGGGNLIGYFQNDKIRFNIINLFPDYPIVVLPQGIWVRNDDLNSWHVQKCVRKYCCSPNLTIVLRDSASYDLAKKLFKGSTKLLLAPDSAFQIGPIPRIMNPVFDILWLKRDDLEGTPNFTLPAHPPNLRVHMSQWWRWKTPLATTKIESAYYMCTNGFLYLQRAKVIITDRLHGHIISLLSNIPHVVIDPLGRKITNFHNTWTQSYGRVVVAKTPKEAMAMAVKMLETYEDVLQPKMPFLHLRERSEEELKIAARLGTLP